jgi:membrane protein DedA with SNARE-associated domain/membrane-associated phospholipid phosphatase
VDRFSDILPTLHHVRILGYGAAFLFSFLESLAFVGVVVPGAAFIVLSGTLAAKGYLDLGDLFCFAAAGAILGDGISFRLGKGGHIRFEQDNRIFKPSLLETGKSFFERHGGKSVFLGRFVGLSRAVVPFVAGVYGMEPRRFYLWNLLSAILWAAAHLLAGYFLGQAWRAVETWSTRVGLVLGAVLLFALVAWWVKRFIERRGPELLSFAGSLLASAGKTIAGWPRVRNVLERHPAASDFVRSRFDPAEFRGLPLTLLATLFAYLLLLLWGLTAAVLSPGPVAALDARVGNLMLAFRDPTLVKAFLWVTLLADPTIVACVAAALGVSLFLWNRRAYVAPLLVTMSGCAAFLVAASAALHRPTPPGIASFAKAPDSFPSAHASLAAALYGSLLYLLWRAVPGVGRRLNLSFAGVFLVAAIGLSRLYLGLGYLSDVLAGYLLGSLWLIVGICTTEGYVSARTAAEAAPHRRPSVAKFVTAAVLAASLACYIYSGLSRSPAAYLPPPRAPVVIGAQEVSALPDRLSPKYAENIAGERQQPISILVVARTDAAVSNAFEKAGWTAADPLDVGTALKWLGALVSDASYPSAPVSPSFWSGRVNSLAFEKATPQRTSRQRHQARFWKSELVEEDGRSIYVGTAVLDSGLKWGLVYRIAPDVDAERDAVRRDLLAAGVAASVDLRAFVPAEIGENSFGDPFFTDGRIALIRLK